MFTEVDSVAGAVVQDDLLYALPDGFMLSQVAQPNFGDHLFYKYPCAPICQAVQPSLKYIFSVACHVGFDFPWNGLRHTLNPTVANWLRRVKWSANYLTLSLITNGGRFISATIILLVN